jgi:hypothetical protein
LKISQIGKRDDDEVGCLVDIDSEAARKMFRTMPTTLAGVTALVFGPKRFRRPATAEDNKGPVGCPASTVTRETNSAHCQVPQ